MELSKKATDDLRFTFKNLFGKKFTRKNFTDKNLEELGMLFLSILAEGLKMRAKDKRVDTTFLEESVGQTKGR